MWIDDIRATIEIYKTVPKLSPKIASKISTKLLSPAPNSPRGLRAFYNIVEITDAEKQKFC